MQTELFLPLWVSLNSLLPTETINLACFEGWIPELEWYELHSTPCAPMYYYRLPSCYLHYTVVVSMHVIASVVSQLDEAAHIVFMLI